MRSKKPKLKYLRPKELREILRLPTTVAEAKTIKRRYNALAEAILNGRSHMGKIGCAHCVFRDGRFRCGECRWGNLPRRKTDLYTGKQFRCCAQPFAGRTYDDPDMRAAITLGFNAECTRAGVGTYAYRYCMAHVEWAEEVIRLGGVPEVEA